MAGSLLDSLNNTVDVSAGDAWSREIARRIKELDAGNVKPVSWAEARRQISAFAAQTRLDELTAPGA